MGSWRQRRQSSLSRRFDLVCGEYFMSILVVFCSCGRLSTASSGWCRQGHVYISNVFQDSYFRFLSRGKEVPKKYFNGWSHIPLCWSFHQINMSLWQLIFLLTISSTYLLEYPLLTRTCLALLRSSSTCFHLELCEGSVGIDVAKFACTCQGAHY